MNIEKIIIDILKQANAIDMDSAINPNQLIERCQSSGVADITEIEKCLMSLIDQDLVEYEMNDNTDVTHIWLLS